MRRPKRSPSIDEQRQWTIEATCSASKEDALIQLDALRARAPKLKRNVDAAAKILAEISILRNRLYELEADTSNRAKSHLGAKGGVKPEASQLAERLRSEILARVRKAYTFEGKQFDDVFTLYGHLVDELNYTVMGISRCEAATDHWDKFEARLMKCEAQRKKEASRKARVERQKAMAKAYAGSSREAAATIRSRLSKAHPCPYCGGPLGRNPHADHIHPIAKGGLSSETNMVFVCQPCNGKKRDLTLNQFIARHRLRQTDIFHRLESLGKDF